jgi:hypothetical protein
VDGWMDSLMDGWLDRRLGALGGTWDLGPGQLGMERAEESQSNLIGRGGFNPTWISVMA